MSMESDTTVLPNSEPKRVKRTWKRLKSPNYERMREESKKLKHDILKSLKDYTPPNLYDYVTPPLPPPGELLLSDGEPSYLLVITKCNRPYLTNLSQLALEYYSNNNIIKQKHLNSIFNLLKNKDQSSVSEQRSIGEERTQVCVHDQLFAVFELDSGGL
ncbi:hypothetical protein P8452_53097 [Trifolium repens]|nr:hypothetical protein P8452_53097 [Trifolium repens]